ncbi:hypothetical protein llap_4638 [Limosa lapponica baueri]|uniref:Uncharacterized protein n=1 Tax=Limosa lapponica baueri TaxID=1758121 RepID=A0A2I0UG74_LIMLA|nr:hypothetical protein llap_4638 [Limosa lapponica baueri]
MVALLWTFSTVSILSQNWTCSVPMKPPKRLTRGQYCIPVLGSYTFAQDMSPPLPVDLVKLVVHNSSQEKFNRDLSNLGRSYQFGIENNIFIQTYALLQGVWPVCSGNERRSPGAFACSPQGNILTEETPLVELLSLTSQSQSTRRGSRWG